MKITPLEIRQKTFEKAFRGVDKEEVQAFLQSLSQEWDRVLTENRELKMQLEIALRDVQKMREVESSLYKTLKTAEDTSHHIIEQAQKQAELQLRETQLACDQLMSQTRDKARGLLDDTNASAEKAIAEMQHEIKGLEQEYSNMERYLENMVRELSNLANEALDKVEKARAKPKNMASSIIKRAAAISAPKAQVDEIFGEKGKTVSSRTVELQPRATNSPIPNPGPKTDPAPDVNTPQPEIEQPVTPVPEPKAPEVERPKPEVPAKDQPRGPEVEQPAKDYPKMPGKPEVQPPLTNQLVPEPAAVNDSKSFFDLFE